MTLAQTAAALKVSRQTIDKYERARMRVSAHTLWQDAHLFKKPIGYFFDGLDQGGNPTPRAHTPVSRLSYWWRSDPCRAESCGWRSFGF